MIASIYKFLVSDYLNPLLLPSGGAGSGEVYGILLPFPLQLLVWFTHRFNLVRKNSIDCLFFYFFENFLFFCLLCWQAEASIAVRIVFSSRDSYINAAPLGNFNSHYTAVGSNWPFWQRNNKDKFSFFCWRIWTVSGASLDIKYRLLFSGLTVSPLHSYY